MLKYKINNDEINLKNILELIGPHTRYLSMTDHYHFESGGAFTGGTRIYKQNIERIRFKGLLEPYKLAFFQTHEWYCYETTLYNKLDVYVFEYNEKTADTILAYSDNILFLDKTGSVLPVLEDICFWRADRSLILGTVSHERIAHLYLNEEEKNFDVAKGLEKSTMKYDNCNIKLPLF